MRTRYVLAATLLGFVLLFSATAGRADSITFSTIPLAGKISGTPGSTVGWGYNLNNNTPDWVLFTSLGSNGFSVGTPSGLFLSGGLQLFAPHQTQSATFDATASQGLFQVMIDPGAAIGASDSGTFLLVAWLFSGNPFGTSSNFLGSETLSADYTVTVKGTKVPEPSVLLLLSIGFLGVAIVTKKRLVTQCRFPVSS